MLSTKNKNKKKKKKITVIIKKIKLLKSQYYIFQNRYIKQSKGKRGHVFACLPISFTKCIKNPKTCLIHLTVLDLDPNIFCRSNLIIYIK